MLPNEYSGFHLHFRYPVDWELSEEVTDEEASITVASPETAFWSATVLRHRPDPERVLRAALLAFEEEYEELDVTETGADLDDACGAEVNFVCMELTNTAVLQAMRTEDLTLLVLYQFNDAEHELTLQQITDGLIVGSEPIDS